MNNKNFLRKSSIAILMFGVNLVVKAQPIDLKKPAEMILKGLEGAFIVFALIGLAFVGKKAMVEYNDNNKDFFAGAKVIVMYVVFVVLFIGVYRYIKTLSL